MADDAGSCIGACCGICIVETLNTWCMTSKCGIGGDGSAGCCGSCCKGSFDRDEFAEERRQQRKAREGEHGDHNAEKPVDAQPGPTQGMATPT